MRLVKTHRVYEPRQTLEPGCHSTCPLARMLSSLPAKAPHASRGARSLLSRKVGSFVARAEAAYLQRPLFRRFQLQIVIAEVTEKERAQYGALAEPEALPVGGGALAPAPQPTV